MSEPLGLVDQMRTCAAALTASQVSGNLDINLMAGDAARLLTEAADLLDVHEPINAAVTQALQRHFDDGSKRNRLSGNDAQAMRSIGRQR
jgi:hypothetical protein